MKVITHKPTGGGKTAGESEQVMRSTTVNGIKFEVWSDFVARATFARNTETGEEKPISNSGYIHNDLTVRKAIAFRFQLPTFRK